MLLRRVARPLLAGIFIQGGIAALRDPKPYADMAAPVVDRATEALPFDDPPSTETLVRVDAGVKIAAGTLLALGRAPRLSAMLLAASLVPTTVAGHRFWEARDPNQRMSDETHLMKNLGLLGGLMLAAADTGGKPSLGWRARRARRTSAATAALVHRDVGKSLGQLSERAGRLSGELADAAGKAGGRAAEAVSTVSGQAVDAAHRLTPKASRARKRAAKRFDRMSKRFDRMSKRASKASSRQVNRAAARARAARARVEAKLA